MLIPAFAFFAHRFDIRLNSKSRFSADTAISAAPTGHRVPNLGSVAVHNWYCLLSGFRVNALQWLPPLMLQVRSISQHWQLDLEVCVDAGGCSHLLVNLHGPSSRSADNFRQLLQHHCGLAAAALLICRRHLRVLRGRRRSVP